MRGSAIDMSVVITLVSSIVSAGMLSSRNRRLELKMIVFLWFRAGVLVAVFERIHLSGDKYLGEL